MTGSAPVLVVGQDSVLGRLPTRLQLEGIEALGISSPEQLQSILLATDGRAVAVVDGGLPEELFSRFCDLLHRQNSVPSLVIVPRENLARLMASASAKVECVPGPSGLEELALRTKATILRAGFDLPGSLAEDNSVAHGEPRRMRTGRIVGVFSAKGGVGKSTIAVNMAIGLSRFFQHRTLLVDSNLWFGDAGFLLNVDSRRTLVDLCSGMDPDVASLRQAVVEHESGIAVLQRPTDLRQAEAIDPKAIGKVLVVAASVFDFVVVDMQSILDEATLHILDAVDQILLVTTPEVSAISNTSRFLAAAEELGYKSKIGLVVNRSNSGVNLGAVQRTLGIEVIGTVVSAGHQVVQAGNEGVSVFSRFSEECQIAQDLAGLVEKVAGQPRVRPEEHSAREVAPMTVGAGFRNLVAKWC